jgi:polysaccharide biosynthesis transport protein
LEALDQQSAFTPQGLLAMARRRRWLIMGGFLVGWGTLNAVSWFLPARYRSETLIIVEQQRVPEHYVTPNVAADLQQRLQSMTEQILSRTRLQAIIENFHLYNGEQRRMDEDALVQRMRKDISIDLVKSPGRPDELSAFKISYSAPEPRLAQQVTTELTALFIQENLRSREQQSEDTTAFLDNELQSARKNLGEQEQKLRQFKTQYLGELPEQLQSNLQILSGLQARLQSATDALNQAEQQKLYLQSLESQYKNLRPHTADAKDSGSSAADAGALDDKLQALRAQLAEISTHYTQQHPDVVRLKHQIAAAEADKAALEHAPQGAGREGSRRTSGGDLQTMSPLVQVDSQLRANTLEITNRQAEIKHIQGEIDRYQARLNVTPMREQQLTALSRDYEQSKTNYESLLAKRMQSEMATNLEKKQQGQQFSMIDPPSLPQKPYWPNRLQFSLAGFVAGIGLGGALAMGLELLNPRVNSREELRLIVTAPILADIPRLQTAEEERAGRRRLVLELTGAAILLASVPAVTLFTFLKG